RPRPRSTMSRPSWPGSRPAPAARPSRRPASWACWKGPKPRAKIRGRFSQNWGWVPDAGRGSLGAWKRRRQSTEPAMSRFAILVYGLASYLLFLGVFVYGMGFIGGIATPTSLDAAPTKSLGRALAIDLGLLSLFAVQHSGMARPAFKRWWTRIVPESAE